MQQIVRIVFYTFLFQICISPVFPQDYSIKNFGINEGISHPFVYTINQDNQGYIWIGTGEGLCRFNGFSFNSDNVPDTLKGEVAGVSFKDSQGNLWFGFHNGQLTKFNGKKFTLINTDLDINSAITGITELTDGAVLVSTLNNGLFSVDIQTNKAILTEGVQPGTYTSFCVNGNILLLGSVDGLSIYSLDNKGHKAIQRVVVNELEFTRIQDILSSSASNIYWVATEDKGLFGLHLEGEKYDLDQAGKKFNLDQENIQAVYEDKDKNLWLSSLRNGIYFLGKYDGNTDFNSLTVYNKQKGLAGDAIKRIFRDAEGNIWAASYGEGISLFTVQSLEFTEFNQPGLNNDIRSLAVNGNTYFIGGPEGLFRYRKDQDKNAIKISGIPDDIITTLTIYEEILYIGTYSNGLFVMDASAAKARKIPYDAYSMGNWISGIAVNSKHVYLGTKDGIYQFSKDLKEEAHYTTTNGMPHNNIEHILIDKQNRLLFATRTNGIYQLSEEGETIRLYSTGNAVVKFKSIAEDEDGGIWAGTYGDGIIYFTGDSVYQYTLPDGLKADYCYSIITGPKKSIWVGHRMGISRININNNRISVYDQNAGFKGDCNLNSVCRDTSGSIYFGTTGGLVSYNLSNDRNRQSPPYTNLVSVIISDRPYNADKPIILPYQSYKLRIEFIGLNYNDPQGVRYQYKLEGYDQEWSDVTAQNSASYSRVEDGEYTFYVRSYNSEGISQETPMSFTIRIKPPVWKTWWFIALMLITVTGLVYFIIKLRERKQKQLQEYLERELIARTKEVVEQKEVIEIKNRDITDSINYAKRIQTSMLPPIKRLQQHFSGSFVFYSPRDIVSGDFYWFDQVNESKFTIVCADSTGHGVPGAFMSMIGSTLIKDICSREAGNSPSKVLQVLDCELRNMLNQNQDDGTKPGDGMDIIVCEIDLRSHYVRYASAMRPMIIYRSGEEIFVKGSRNSVGGHYEKENNLFEDEGLQLSKGDIIYMFSDGYSDQFGGPMGKKFKMVRLKNLLQDIHNKPMDEQCLHVKNTFNLWKENFEQVDDVLFMGIKI